MVSNSGPSTDYFHKNCRVSHKTNIRETKFYKLWYPIFFILIKEHPEWLGIQDNQVNNYQEYKCFGKLISVIVSGTPLDKDDPDCAIVNHVVMVGCFPKPSMRTLIIAKVDVFQCFNDVILNRMDTKMQV